MGDQRFIDIIDSFREWLSNEQLRHADTAAANKELKRQLEQKDNQIENLQQQLEKYLVPTETGNTESNVTK